MRAIWDCPVLSAGEEIDSAIEYTRSLVEMALDLGDTEWAARVGRTYHLLLCAQEAGVGKP